MAMMETGMSDGQALALCLATTITGSLSLLGSFYVIYDVLSSPAKWKLPSNRFLVTLSTADMLSTLGHIQGVFFMPSSTGLPYAYGTTMSCESAGMFANFMTAVVFANCNLSFYFVWTVKKGWKEAQIARYEPYLHSFPFIISAIMMIACLVLDGYNPRSLLRGCGLEHYPLECQWEDSIECTRGQHNDALSLAQTALGVLPTLVGIWNTIVVYRAVTQSTTQARVAGSQGSNAERRNRRVMIQSILYMASFLNSFIWPMFVAFIAKDNVRMSQAGGPFYILLFLSHFMLPIQGVLNVFIFKRKAISDKLKERRSQRQSRNETTATDAPSSVLASAIKGFAKRDSKGRDNTDGAFDASVTNAAFDSTNINFDASTNRAFGSSTNLNFDASTNKDMTIDEEA